MIATPYLLLLFFYMQEVLGGLVDGAISLDDDGVGVVRDTLAILACKEIKLASLRRYHNHSSNQM